jgi:hypothetical protein
MFERPMIKKKPVKTGIFTAIFLLRGILGLGSRYILVEFLSGIPVSFDIQKFE